MRVTSTRTIARRRLGDRRLLEAGLGEQLVEARVAGQHVSPRPCRRTIRGGPSKAQNITTMRPFSRRWAIVSAPLPTYVEVGDAVRARARAACRPGPSARR